MKNKQLDRWVPVFRRLSTAIVFSTLPAGAPLVAQEVAEESAKDEDEIIMLSTFEVDTTQDYGYRATGSQTALRLAGKVIDMPMAVNILPEEFIEDLHFDSTQEAGRYMANVLADERVSTHDGGGVLYVRGFRTPKQRNGVESFGAANLNAVDRIEVIKGPVGVFYGNTAPGGIFNVVTKKPEFTNGGSVEYSYGSYDFHSAKVDAQVSGANNTLGVRVNGTYLNYDDWRDLENGEEKYITASIRWRPNSKLDMTYEYEYAKMERNDGVNDVVSNPMYHQEYAVIPDQILSYFKAKRGDQTDEQTSDYLRGRWLLNAGRWAADHREATGEYVFRETGFIDPYLISPRGNKFNRNGEGAFDNNAGESHLFNIGYAPTDWLAVRYQYYDISTERQVVANFFVNANADYSLRMRDNFNNTARGRRMNHQLDLKFRWDTDNLGNHQFIYGYEDQTNQNYRNGTHVFDWERLPDMQIPADPWFKGGDIPLGENPITVSGNVYRNRWNPYLMEVPNYSDAIASVTQPQRINDTWTRGHYVTYMGAFFDRRLNTMVGMRFEEESDGDKGETPRIGAVYEFVPGWRVFGSYSEQWRPNGDNVTGPGSAELNPFELANEEGVGTEIGIKTNFRDNTISGSISWFTLDRKNIRQQNGARNTDDPRNNDGDQLNNVTWWELSGLERVEGFETDLIWTPNQSFQLMVTYSWNYTANIVSDPSRTVPEEAAFQNGRVLHNAPAHNLATWGKYSIREGRWKGFSFGLGFRYTSEAESGNNQPWRYHINPDYSLWDARLAYETDRIGKRTVFSLNFENLLDQTWYTGLGLGDPFKAYFKIKTYF